MIDLYLLRDSLRGYTFWARVIMANTIIAVVLLSLSDSEPRVSVPLLLCLAVYPILALLDPASASPAGVYQILPLERRTVARTLFARNVGVNFAVLLLMGASWQLAACFTGLGAKLHLLFYFQLLAMTAPYLAIISWLGSRWIAGLRRDPPASVIKSKPGYLTPIWRRRIVVYPFLFCALAVFTSVGKWTLTPILASTFHSAVLITLAEAALCIGLCLSVPWTPLVLGLSPGLPSAMSSGPGSSHLPFDPAHAKPWRPVRTALLRSLGLAAAAICLVAIGPSHHHARIQGGALRDDGIRLLDFIPILFLFAMSAGRMNAGFLQPLRAMRSLPVSLRAHARYCFRLILAPYGGFAFPAITLASSLEGSTSAAIVAPLAALYFAFLTCAFAAYIRTQSEGQFQLMTLIGSVVTFMAGAETLWPRNPAYPSLNRATQIMALILLVATVAYACRRYGSLYDALKSSSAIYRAKIRSRPLNAN